MTVRISDAVQLFVDDYLVETAEKVSRTFHQVEKSPQNPVLRGDGPEQEGGVLVFGSVLHEDDLFKMYYFTADHSADNWRHQRLVYSKDGLQWERPSLGLIELNGSKDNNIVFSYLTHSGFLEGLEPVRDPRPADANKRYRSLFTGGHWSRDTVSIHKDRPRGMYAAWSPDGLRWGCTDKPIPALGLIAHDRASLMYDTLRNRWIAFLKDDVTEYDRVRMISFSDDCETWSPWETLFVGGRDEKGTLKDLYFNNGFVYGDMYLGQLVEFCQDPNHPVLDIHLITSRDGRHWERAPAGGPFIPVGGSGEWDRFNNQPTSSGPLRIGDQLYFYYSGRTYRHSHQTYSGNDKGESNCYVGLATLRIDGFASLDASFNGGVVTTKPLQFDPGALRVNAKADFGSVAVEALDVEAKPIPGYTLGECIPMKADSVDALIKWQKRDLARISGNPVRLRFRLTNARLYSFRIAGDTIQ